MSGMCQRPRLWEVEGTETVVTPLRPWSSKERFWMLTGVRNCFLETVTGKLVISLSSWVNFACGGSILSVVATPEKEKNSTIRLNLSRVQGQNYNVLPFIAFLYSLTPLSASKNISVYAYSAMRTLVSLPEVKFEWITGEVSEEANLY